MTNRQYRRAMKHIERLRSVVKNQMRIHRKYSNSKDIDMKVFHYIWRWGINRMKEQLIA